MGVYIEHRSKEQWLKDNCYGESSLVPPPPGLAAEMLTINILTVCLVDNGPFSAAAIAYSMEEFRRFTEPGDPRSKVWFFVPKDKLMEVSELYRYMPEETQS